MSTLKNSLNSTLNSTTKNKQNIPLKILVVLPIYGGSLPIGEYCISALKDLGHKVEVFQAPDFQKAQLALSTLKVSAEKNDFLQNTFAGLLSEAIYAKVERFEPDLVLALAQAPLTRAVLKRLERDKIPTAMWFVEDYRLFTYWRSYANLYSHFFVIQKEPFLTLLREGGHQQAHYLPMAALPNFHKKIELSPQDKTKYGSDVSFLGAGYANRRQEFKKLLSFKFKIWGSDWAGEPLLNPYIQNNGARVDSETSVKVYNATKINLNLHSSIHAEGAKDGDFVNPRTFELASMQAFQLVDKRKLMPELFDIDGYNKELITFENFDEVPDLINYYLNHEDERKAITERAMKKVHTKHTYQQRMKAMIKIINPTPINIDNYDEYLSAMPEDLRKEFVELTKKLELPVNADFSEVVNTLRNSQHNLTSLEASILFLDEWRKQYS